MGARARVLLAAAIALLIGVVAAPAALAVSATVRVEGTPYQVAPATAVSVPDQGTIVDSDGTSFAYTKANAFAALDRAAALRGFAYGFNTSYGAPFLEMVAGLTADPSDWSNGWTYMVNGVGYPILDMGAIDFLLAKGDRVVFTQNPDATFARGAKLLRLSFAPGRAVKPGETVTISVLGDDVAKANSTSEATRYGLDPVADPSVVEKPADFAPAVGATLHVGSRVYVDGDDGDVADGKIAVADLPNGTYGVWAEKAMDASYTYVRTGTHHVNVDFGPRVTNVTASATLAGTRLAARAAFTLDKRCDVRVTVFNQRGKLLAAMRARGLDGGRHAMAWRGQPGAAVTGWVSFVVKATDAWGRVTTKSVAVRVAR
jgi:hypothetical protein